MNDNYLDLDLNHLNTYNDTTYNIQHKVSINLNMIDNQAMWSMIYSQNTKYAASRIESAALMKYFGNGITLVHANDFQRKFREITKYEPKSNWVVLISLSGELEPNDNEMIRMRNRTMLVASCNLESITEHGDRWPDPGMALDPKMITYKSTHINYKTGAITIRGTVPNGLQLKETPHDHLRALRKIINPMTEELTSSRILKICNPYESEEGRTMMLDFAKELLRIIGIEDPMAEENRKRLVAYLTHQEDPYAYVVKGVPFASEREYELRLSMMRHRLPLDIEKTTILYNNGYGEPITATQLIEMFALKYEHDKPHTERLLQEFPNDPNERLRNMTLQQVTWFPDHWHPEIYYDFTLGLTDDELTEMIQNKDNYPVFHDLVVKRWHEVNKK